MTDRPLDLPTDPSDATPVIAVVGPTATGKTALSVALAKAVNGEIISADSQLVYREMDIGTAKPTPGEKQGVPHHMIDLVAPDEDYSAARYQSEASTVLADLRGRGTVPVVAGGTGFYLKSLLQAGFIPSVSPNPAFRARMLELAEREGSPALHAMLAEKDPLRAGDLHPNDRVRIVRALEIIEATGEPVPRKSEAKRLPVTWIGLYYENRDILRARIDARIDAMMAEGWLDEVRRLVAVYGPEARALGVTHGYPELLAHLQGETTLEDALEQIRINIHQYARRQLTWFRRNPDIHWFALDELPFDALFAESLRLTGRRSG